MGLTCYKKATLADDKAVINFCRTTRRKCLSEYRAAKPLAVLPPERNAMPRHLAIGDIHGCDTALRTLLELVQLRNDDVIITLGDYVNRGPGTFSVIEILLELKSDYTVHCLRGNHELLSLIHI